MTQMDATQDRRADSSHSRVATYTVVVIALILVILTLVFSLSPSWSWEGLSVLAVLWIVLGFVMYVNAARAFHEPRSDRPHLSMGKGIPAWTIFLAGTFGLAAIVTAWVVWGRMREAMVLAGVSIVFVSMAYPRVFSLRRAIVSGIGLFIAAVLLVVLS